MKNFKDYSKEEIIDLIDAKMESTGKKQYEILRELRLDSRVIGRYRKVLKRPLRKSNTDLTTRLHICRDIAVGILTIKKAAHICNRSTTTIRNWIQDYNLYGEEIPYLATGFNHYKV